MKVLIVAAHPDDELLGPGGAIIKHIEQKDDVYVCIVTKAWGPKWDQRYINKKQAEQKKIDNYLGIKKRYLCGLKTVNLNALPIYVLTDAIMKVFNEVRPDIVYTHCHCDMNKDHEMVFSATLAVANPVKTRCKLITFETVSSTEWGAEAFKPNYYVEISDHLDKKIKALSFYETEMQNPPHPRSSEGIKVLAEKRGFEGGVKYAEAFQIIRDYW